MRNRTKALKHDKRLTYLSVLFSIVSFLLIYRLFTIQVLGHEEYASMANDQHWKHQTLPAKRGDILSSDGFPLATTQISYLVYAEPKKISNLEDTAIQLAQVLVSFKVNDLNIPDPTNEKGRKQEVEETKDSLSSNIDPTLYLQEKERILNLLKLDLFWVIISRNVDPFEKDIIAELNLEGIGFEEQPIRYYPENNLASHILGFVASDDAGDSKGYFGVEGRLDGDLKGKSGRIIEERDANGMPILVGGYNRVKPIQGRNVILTVNRAVQFIVEKRLKEGVVSTGAKSGTVIIMDPKSGDIIAMANYPDYDPSNFNDEATESTETYKPERRNLAISETYEPGSVIKALTVAAGIDSGKVSPYTTFQDNGPVEYSEYTIDNWDKKHHGEQNLIQLLQKSNNIGSAWVGHVIGSKDLSEYFRSFGLGEISGIDLEGEDSGVINDYKNWTDIDLATAAFGQGISATPLQVINSFNAIANDGELMQPRIISQIIDEGNVINLKPKVTRRVLSKQAARTVSDMLVQAVEEGESKYFNIKTYIIAGKTGTAQIPIDGKYDPTKTNATFVGYLATSKKYSMLVRLNQPEVSTYAAETAVPLWMTITQDLVNYYGISPDK